MTPDLERFLTAQNPVYDQVLRELRAERKTSHWMWFIFPQLAGLGRSRTAAFYALGSLAEACAYADHPVLGARLRECTTLVLASSVRSLTAIFGSIDALKFQSCMTLFVLAAGNNLLFQHALDRFCDGQRDEVTIRLLGGTATK